MGEWWYTLVMLKILESQKDFLDSHKIPLSRVFDASGMRAKDYREYMEEYDYSYAVGVTPCKKKGHTLRAKAGQCIQCFPANIEFRNRTYKEGFVYLAGSVSNKVIKIGLTNDVDSREESLNEQEYGSIYDWKIIYWLQLGRDGGRLEYLIQNQLNMYASPRTFIKGGRTNNCLEIFSCSFSTVKKTIDIILNANDFTLIDNYTNKKIINKYNFRNKKGNYFYIEGNINKSQIINIKDTLINDDLLFIDTEEKEIKKKKPIKKKKTINKKTKPVEIKKKNYIKKTVKKTSLKNNKIPIPKKKNSNNKENNNSFLYVIIFFIFIVGLYFIITP